MPFDAQAFRQAFPFFEQYPEMIYWDNAATTQKPQVVIDTMSQALSASANVHRASHDLAAEKTQAFERARANIAAFIGAQSKEVVFNRGATEGLNHVARGLEHCLAPGDEIVVSLWEHHANLIPWQQLAMRQDLKLTVLAPEQLLDYDFQHTRLFAATLASNVLGKPAVSLAFLQRLRQQGVITVLDAAQAVAHQRIDVSQMPVDFLVFSGHKLFAPEGVGVLYVHSDWRMRLKPMLFGGEMVTHVSATQAEFKPAPYSYEAGTAPISAVLSLAQAIAFFAPVLKPSQAYLQQLVQPLLSELRKRGLQLLNEGEHGIISFYGDFDSLDLALLLAESQIAIRAGKHCAEPLLQHLGVSQCLRLSLAPYNTQVEVEQFLKALDQSLALLAG
ncbi:MAG: aminotransferase class V-fold PLP-dependent enzyme [Pseudomonadota bacterium]|nr:aminotransferase class V-fold PLP-dependent enzyme [Pseudomonadota bacterium]